MSKFTKYAAIIVILGIIATVVFGRQGDFARYIEQINPAATSQANQSGPRDGLYPAGSSPRNSRGDICQNGEPRRPNEAGGGR